MEAPSRSATGEFHSASGFGCPTRAEAIHTFVPQGDDKESQLALVAGDVVEVLEKDSSGWWAGHMDGKNVTGWFPAAAVRELASEDQGSRTQNARPQTSRASVGSSCSGWSASSISMAGDRSTRAAQPVHRSTSSCSALSPRGSWETSRKASALSTADGRPVASPLGKHDGRRFATPLPCRDAETTEKIVEKDTRKQVPASPAPSRSIRNNNCGSTPQTSRVTSRRVGTPLCRRAVSPKSSEVGRQKAPKPSPSPGPRRSSVRQATPISARPATQKSLASSPGSGSPLTGSGQLSQLRQASRRLTTPLGARESQTSRSQSLNPRRNSSSKPTSGGGLTSTRCSDGGTGSTSVQLQQELLLEERIAERKADLSECGTDSASVQLQQERLLEERVAERKAEQAEQEAQALRLRLSKMEEALLHVQAEMRGKESRIRSLESAQTELCVRQRSKSDADGVSPSVQELIASFEERTPGRLIPTARRSLPPPQGSSPL